MTLENYQYRTSPLFLRNQFLGSGRWNIPVIPKADFDDADFRDLLLIGFDRTKLGDDKNQERMVHFFLYDYKFERVWENPDSDVERLRQYRAVLTPDFSMYLEMAPVLQLYNTFRNRWCGAYWASKGLRVIPTINWGDESTFDFCFEGVPKGSTVAVSTFMVSAHGNHADQKEFFMKGYREMLRRIEPERIICYNEPFPEMEGNIIYVDYELSSWKYQGKEYTPSKYLPYICGEKPLPANSGIVIKTGYVMRESVTGKGSGSAEGGSWKPKKPADEVLIGPPDSVKEHTVITRGKGYKILVKYDTKGYAVRIRHFTDHSCPGRVHTNPHDHKIDWSHNFPDWTEQINYQGEPPEFKCFKEVNMIKKGKTIIIRPEDVRFTSIGDFKWSMHCGGEIQFEWKAKTYAIFAKQHKTPSAPEQILFTQTAVENQEETFRWFDTADDVLELVIDGDRLRDIITQVEVFDRNI